MPEGRILGKILLWGIDGGAPVEYSVREHGEPSQPPKYIRKGNYISRELRYGDQPITFFKGQRGDGRVTFKHGGVWCYIDQRHNINKPNLHTHLFGVAADESAKYEYSTTTDFEREVLNSPFREL